jgi:serine/threonine protein kinase
VGKYRLERLLGRGAQGTTFLATGPDGICAVKELQLGRTSGGKATELFHREAAVLAQLSHDNIPDLYDHFVDGIGVARSLYVVQQFIAGQNLEERLETHRFTEMEVRDILGQVAEILRYLHTLSPPVIHRDIKPSNLILDNEGQVHLIDFGAVRDVMRDSVGGGSTVAGTFGYMAPEQLIGDATPQSDLYALGMTAIRLLTREHPTALADRMGNMDWRSRTTVTEPFAEWIDSLVHMDAAKRPTDGRLPQSTSIRAVLTRESIGESTATERPISTRQRAFTKSNAGSRINLTHWMLAIRRTNTTIEVGRRLDSQDRRDIAKMVVRKLGSTKPDLFKKTIRRDPEKVAFNLTVLKQGPNPLGALGAGLYLQIETDEATSLIHIQQLHADGWIPSVLALTVPLFVGFIAFGVVVGETSPQSEQFVTGIFMLSVLLAGSVGAVACWIFSNIFAAYYQGNTKRFIDSIIKHLNGGPNPNEQVEQVVATLPMEERHPQPVAFDMSKSPTKTRN